jgi:hypothetical protein
MDAISFVTLTASQTTIEFSNIPQTYSHLQLKALANITTADSTGLTLNGDTGSNYKSHRFYANATSFGATVAAGVTTIGFASTSGFPSTASTFGIGILDILDYTNTNKYKVTRALCGWDNNSAGYVDFGSGLWMNTAAITTLKITTTSGSFIANSTFALYGIR